MKLAFALEYSLGHVTHAQNLKSALAARTDIQPYYVDIPYEDTPLPPHWRSLGPVRSNWSLRASLCASHGLRAARDASAALFHTQVTSLLSAGYMRRVPSVVSLDATPLQYDALGAFYGHAVGGGPLEALKKRLNVRAFASAARLVTWSEWAKGSLVADYGVESAKVTVIPPGIDLRKWKFERSGAVDGLRILFVGGDFARKGGESLLEAFRMLKLNFPDARLSVVTKSEGVADGEDGVDVHRGVTPNSPELLAQYEWANVFAFPTRGDCLPLAVMEALAAGLPVVTTAVGALGEAVEDGVCGMVVAQDDPASLAAALCKLAAQPHEIARMSAAARARAEERFDLAVNYSRLIDLIASVAGNLR